MNDFRSRVLKLNEHRVHKVNNSVGVYDIYKAIRKNKWYSIGRPITEHLFYTIIRTINNFLAADLLQGNDIVLPCRLGRLELRKYNAFIRLVDGKIQTNLPIDWDRTLKLWAEDEESYKNKTLIKTEDKEIFKVFYNKATANYWNKAFYSFEVNRDIKRNLKTKIKAKTIDAFLL